MLQIYFLVNNNLNTKIICLIIQPLMIYINSEFSCFFILIKIKFNVIIILIFYFILFF